MGQIVRGGVAYNITDMSVGSGLSEADVIRIIDTASRQPTVAKMNFAEASGWVTGGDGFLVIDLNQDGIINNSSKMFGDQTGYANGFLALSAYDSNSDGYITSEDAGWLCRFS